MQKVKNIIMRADKHVYTFNLPREVEVSDDMRSHQLVSLYILLQLLGIEPTIEDIKDSEDKDTDVYF